MVGRVLPNNATVSIETVGDVLLGLGAARNLAESLYDGEHIQLQVDAHTRFDADWDLAVVATVARLGDEAILTSAMRPEPWTGRYLIPTAEYTEMRNYKPVGNVVMVEPPTGRLAEVYPARTCLLYTSPSPRDRTRSRMPSSA